MDLRAASPTYDRVMNNFERSMQELIETGFVTLDMPQRKLSSENWRGYWTEVSRMWPVGASFHRKIARKVAKELKRPVVIVEQQSDGSYWATIRRSQARAVLVAQYMLLDSNNSSRWQKPTDAVSFRQNGTNWYVKFSDDAKGQRAFSDWKRHCTTHPDCRKVLKLPPLEEAVKLAA